ncbi:MAG: hypothetical protein HRT76_15050 [Halieaceae bacterium]|nr:hypothetical protein [Halieaceae bacterium]
MPETESTSDQNLESRLIGWKRISNYLGCSERTARRWEREERLPVHRQSHEKRSTVFALPAELDRWLGSRADFAPVPPIEVTAERLGNNRFKLGASLAAALVVIAVAAIWPRPTGERPHVEIDPIAVDLFERGSALWQQRGEEPNRQAVKLLSRAVERDDKYAAAWSALATAWMTLPTYSDEANVSEAIDEALLAADRALQLDPTMVEARAVMASIAKARGDWLTSERIYRDALEIDRDSTSLMLWFAGHYRELGLMDEAVKLTNKASSLEPISPPILTEVAMNHYQLGQVELAREQLDYLWSGLGVETPVVWVGLWLSMIELGEYEAANAWLAKAPYSAFVSALRGYITVVEATPDGLEAFVSEIRGAYGRGMPGWLAFHLLDRAGESDLALEILDRETSQGYFENSVVLFFERGGTTRSRAEFADFVERLGFYEYWRERRGPDMCERDSQSALCQRLVKQN